MIRHIHSVRSVALLSLFSALLLSALPESAAAQCGTTPPTGSVTWTTNWCDEFNGAANSTIDPANWTYDTGGGGFGNNELETYCAPTSNTSPCSTSSPNAYIDGSGHLAIQVRLVGSTYTSARLKTQGLQSFHSGRIEGNIQIPSHAGLWPAFWNLGGKGKCFTLPNGGQVNTAFHAYGEIWSANMIQFYLDDATQPFFVVTASDLPAGDVWPFSSSADAFFIIMNMAVGGTLGAPTDSATGSQAPMLVDYVRQYLPSTVPAPQMTPSGSITVTAGATTGNTTTINMTSTTGSGRVAFSCSTNAPKASCLVTSTDAVNKYTVDFSNSSSGSATVTVTTTANTRRGGHSNGTPPGNYTVTVNACREFESLRARHNLRMRLQRAL